MGTVYGHMGTIYMGIYGHYTWARPAYMGTACLYGHGLPAYQAGVPAEDALYGVHGTALIAIAATRPDSDVASSS
jgi:hypothetical protein